MNPIFPLLLGIVQTRQAMEHRRMQEYTEIAEREREVMLQREADRAQEQRESEQAKRHADYDYAASWQGSRTDAVDEALSWGRAVGVPDEVLAEMERMRVQVAALADTPEMSGRAKALLEEPRAEIDEKLQTMHTDLGILIAEHDGIVDSTDARVQAVQQRLAEMVEPKQETAESSQRAVDRPRQRARRQAVRKAQKGGDGMEL